MPGAQRHPLERTYDEMQRTKTRIERYLEMFKPFMKPEEVKNLEKALKGTNQVLDAIPKEYRKTYKQWRSDADNE